MIKTIVGYPATLRFGVVQDRLRYLSEKDALRRFRMLAEVRCRGQVPQIADVRCEEHIVRDVR
jgi:hypothetical protein